MEMRPDDPHNTGKALASMVGTSGTPSQKYQGKATPIVRKNMEPFQEKSLP
jgi:hypothetical protein